MTRPSSVRFRQRSSGSRALSRESEIAPSVSPDGGAFLCARCQIKAFFIASIKDGPAGSADFSRRCAIADHAEAFRLEGKDLTSVVGWPGSVRLASRER